MKPPDVKDCRFPLDTRIEMTQPQQRNLDLFLRLMPEFDGAEEGLIRMSVAVDDSENSSYVYHLLIYFNQGSMIMHGNYSREVDGNHSTISLEKVVVAHQSDLIGVTNELNLKVGKAIRDAKLDLTPEEAATESQRRRVEAMLANAGYGKDEIEKALKDFTILRYVALYRAPEGEPILNSEASMAGQVEMMMDVLTGKHPEPCVFVAGIDTTSDVEKFYPVVRAETTQDRRRAACSELQVTHGILYDMPDRLERYAAVVEGGSAGRRVVHSGDLEYLVRSGENNQLDIQALVDLDTGRRFRYEWKLDIQEER